MIGLATKDSSANIAAGRSQRHERDHRPHRSCRDPNGDKEQLALAPNRPADPRSRQAHVSPAESHGNGHPDRCARSHTDYEATSSWRQPIGAVAPVTA